MRIPTLDKNWKQKKGAGGILTAVPIDVQWSKELTLVAMHSNMLRRNLS